MDSFTISMNYKLTQITGKFQMRSGSHVLVAALWNRNLVVTNHV